MGPKSMIGGAAVRVFPLVLLLVSTIAPGPLRAQEPGEEEAPSAAALQEQGDRLYREGRALLVRREFAAALERFRGALARFQCVPNPLAAAWMHGWAASCLEGLSCHEEALEEHRARVAGMRALCGERDDPALAEALGNLASCLSTLGRSVEALPLHQEALAMVRRLEPKDHPVLVTCIGNVACCLDDLGRLAEALPLHEEALRMSRRLFRGDHQVVARRLNNLAGCLKELGRARDALPVYEQSVEMLRRLHPSGHPDVALGLNNVAYCLDELGRLEAALALYGEALRMIERLIPGDGVLRAGAMNNLASALSEIGDHRAALALYEEALAMNRRLFTGDHPGVASALGNLAFCLVNLGRAPEAEPLFLKALEMRRRLVGEEHPEVALALANLGGCLRILGRVSEALPLHERSLVIYVTCFPRDHPDVAWCLTNLAACLTELGRKLEADALQARAWRIFSRLYDGDHPDVAASLASLAGCRFDAGGPEEAAGLLRRVLEMRRRLFEGDHPRVAWSLNNRGECLRLLGRRVEADRLLREAVEMGRRLASPDLHAWQTNLGWLRLLSFGDAEGAAALFAEAVAWVEERRFEARGFQERDRGLYIGRLTRFQPFEGMVRAQVRLGRPAEALLYLERGRARSLLDLLDRSRFDPFEEVERQARARGDRNLLAEIEGVSSALASCEAALGRLTHALGRARGRSDLPAEEKRDLVDGISAELARARVSLREALRVRARLVREQLEVVRAASPEAIQGFLGKGERLLVYSLTHAGALLILVPPPGEEIRAFPLRWPGGETVAHGDVAEAVDAYVEWIARDGRLARGLRVGDAPGNTASDGAAIGHRLFRALVPEEVWQEIRDAPRVHVVPHGPLSRLPFETLVLEPGASAGERRYWLDEGPPIAYGASCSALLWSRRRRDDQARGSPSREAVALGDPVYTRAGAEEGPELPESGVLVLRVPPESPGAEAGLLAGDVILGYDGKAIAHHGALRDRVRGVMDAIEDGEREAKDVVLRIWRRGAERDLSARPAPLGVSVARDPPAKAMERLLAGTFERERHAVERGGLVSRYGGLDPLPGTRREVESIARSLAGEEDPVRVSVLLGEDATKTRLFAAAPRARYLHLATHQLSDETEDASYSSLALTLPPVPTEEDDGFLKLIDLLLHWRGRLRGCELVVLSACETRLGELQRDEEVYAMPWGFMYAGAPSVIASLWRVDDASTAELMSGFYARLEKEAKLTAFTKARRALRKTRPEPYFWAPFVYVGDPR